MTDSKVLQVTSLSPVSSKSVKKMVYLVEDDGTDVLMERVYLVKDGTDEFTPPPGTTVNRAFRLQVKKFLSSHACAVSKFPLQMFTTWFQDLSSLS